MIGEGRRVLRYAHTLPPGGFCYVQPQTGYRMEADSMDGLVELVCRHRQYRKLEPVEPEAVRMEVEDTMCRALPEEFWRAV